MNQIIELHEKQIEFDLKRIAELIEGTVEYRQTLTILYTNAIRLSDLQVTQAKLADMKYALDQSEILAGTK